MKRFVQVALCLVALPGWSSEFFMQGETLFCPDNIVSHLKDGQLIPSPTGRTEKHRVTVENDTVTIKTAERSDPIDQKLNIHNRSSSWLNASRGDNVFLFGLEMGDDGKTIEFVYSFHFRGDISFSTGTCVKF